LLQEVYAKLKKVRDKEDLNLPPNPFLRKEIKRPGRDPIQFKLRNYQKQMVVHLLCMNRFVVGDDTGLGKTIETIAALCYVWINNPDTKAVILTKKSSVPQWYSEFERFTKGVKVILCVGGPKKRAKLQEEWENSTGPTVLIQGYSSACNDFARMHKWEDYTLICDEATVFKTPTTRVHRVCKHLSAQALRCWGLTATLIKNNLMEGYGIYRVVVPTLFKMTANTFMNRFCIVQMNRVARNRRVPQIVGYRPEQLEDFRDSIDPFYLGRPKHAVADDLPVLESRDVTVGLTKFQHTKYQESLGGLLEYGDGGEREVSHLTALIYCQEIVNHPGLISFPDYPSEKLDALVDLLSGGSELEGEKVIVFTRFSTMVGIARAALEKKGIKCTQVTGAEGEKQRKDAMDAFQNPKDPTKVIFITMAGGDAINLQTAKALIFYDTPWSAGDYIQILGRMIRIGSLHDRVFAIHLIARNTIDEHVQKVMHKKKELIEKVLGERLRGEKGGDVMYAAGSETKNLFDAMVADAQSKTGTSRFTPQKTTRRPKYPKKGTTAPAVPKKKSPPKKARRPSPKDIRVPGPDSDMSEDFKPRTVGFKI